MTIINNNKTETSTPVHLVQYHHIFVVVAAVVVVVVVVLIIINSVKFPVIIIGLHKSA